MAFLRYFFWESSDAWEETPPEVLPFPASRELPLISVKVKHGWQSEWGTHLSSTIPTAMTRQQDTALGGILTHSYVALDLLNNISESQISHLQNFQVTVKTV